MHEAQEHAEVQRPQRERQRLLQRLVDLGDLRDLAEQADRSRPQGARLAREERDRVRRVEDDLALEARAREVAPALVTLGCAEKSCHGGGPATARFDLQGLVAAPVATDKALAELGRNAEALAAFASIDPTDPQLRRQLAQLLRTRLTTFAPLLRPALGPRYPALLLAALQKGGEYDDDELAAMRLTATLDLEGLPTASDAAGQATMAAHCMMARPRKPAQ